MEEQIRKLARDFAEQELKKKWEELDCKNPGLLDDILKKSTDIGIFGFLIDEELGGSGFDIKNYCIFVEEIAKSCAGIGVMFVSHLMGISPILLLKDIEKRNKFLKENSSSIFTLAIYEEKFSKIIPDDIKTTIKNNILSGHKINVLCGEIADYFTILAGVENTEKLVLLAIPSGSNGIEIKEEKNKMGLRICPINDIYFHNVKISQENILTDDIKLSDILNYYKFFDSSLSAIAIGMGEEAYNIALKYSTQRYQGGKIICEHDAVKMLLSNMKLQIEIAKNFAYNSSDNFISSSYASEIAEMVCIDAIQILGGYGYMEDFKVERILRDAKTFQTIINPVSRKMEYIENEIKKTGG